MRLVFSLLAVLTLAGCVGRPSYTADLSFSRAQGLGYRNAGLFSPGSLYLFDQSARTLTKISDDISLEKRGDNAPPTTLTSSSIDGIVLSGDFPTDGAKIQAAASVGSKVSFVAENAVRERYSSVYTALAKAYSDGMASGQDIKGQWFVDDVVSRSGLYYVVITEIVTATKTSLSVGGLKDDKVVDVSVSIPGLPSAIKVEVSSGRLVECSGKSSPCFFDVTVIKPYISPNKLLSFRASTTVNSGALSEALRKL